MLDDSALEGIETILLGDINANYAIKTNKKELRRLIKHHGLREVIAKPTRIAKETSTLVDIIATTHDQNFSKQATFRKSPSDHDIW